MNEIDELQQFIHAKENAIVNSPCRTSYDFDDARFLYNIRLRWLSLRREVESGIYDNETTESGGKFRGACLRLRLDVKKHFDERIEKLISGC